VTAPLRLLIVEDNAALRTALATYLAPRGCLLDFAADGRTGLALALANPPDVVVLDVGLPAMDGLMVCRRLRKQADRHVPVLMLTARDALEDKLAGFDIGADDYLVKPFAAEELLARCRALAVRPRAGQSHRLRIGDLELDRRDARAFRAGRALDLNPTPFAILLALAEAWPRALTRAELCERLWGDAVPPSDPLRSHLHLLRRELDPDGAPAMLRTVHGVGWRLEVVE
jgi:DNA-binding response OmpR family regulator